MYLVRFVVLEIVAESLDGINGSDDSTDDADDNDDSAPEQFVPLEMPPSDQLEVAEDWQYEDERAIAKSPEKRQKVTKVWDSASDTTTEAHDDQTDKCAIDTFHNLAATCHCNVNEALKFQSKRGQQDRCSQDNVDNDNDSSDLGEDILRQAGENRRFGLRSISEISWNSRGDVENGAGCQGSSHNTVPASRISHGLLDVHVNNVASKADGNRSNCGGQVGKNDIVVCNDAVILGVVQIHDGSSNSNDDQDDSGEGAKDGHDSDLLQCLHSHKGNSDNSGADPDPCLDANVCTGNELLHLCAGQDHVHNRCAKDDGCVKEPDSNQASTTKGVASNLLIGGEAVLAVVVKTLHQQDGRVDGHEEREQENAYSDPATKSEGVGETKCSGTC